MASRNRSRRGSSTSEPMFESSPRLRRFLDHLLHTHDTPQRTAAAYALGVFLGFSPLLGLHTILGLILAFALSLNRVAVLLGRSEERRVGKECRARWSRCHEKEKRKRDTDEHVLASDMRM